MENVKLVCSHPLISFHTVLPRGRVRSSSFKDIPQRLMLRVPERTKHNLCPHWAHRQMGDRDRTETLQRQYRQVSACTPHSGLRDPDRVAG